MFFMTELMMRVKLLSIWIILDNLMIGKLKLKELNEQYLMNQINITQRIVQREMKNLEIGERV